MTNVKNEDTVEITSNQTVTERSSFLSESTPLIRGDEVHERSFFIRSVQEDEGLTAEIQQITAREFYTATIHYFDCNQATVTSDPRKNRQIALQEGIKEVGKKISESSTDFGKIGWVAVNYTPVVTVYYKLPEIGTTYKFDMDLTSKSNHLQKLSEEVKESQIESLQHVSSTTPIEAEFKPSNNIQSGKLLLKTTSKSIDVTGEKINSINVNSNSIERVNKYLQIYNNRYIDFINESYNDDIRKHNDDKDIIYLTVYTPLELSTFGFNLTYEEDSPLWKLIERVGQGDLCELRGETVYIQPRIENKSEMKKVNSSKSAVKSRSIQEDINAVNIPDGVTIQDMKYQKQNDELFSSKTLIKNHKYFTPVGVDIDYQWNLYIKDEKEQSENQKEEKQGILRRATQKIVG